MVDEVTEDVKKQTLIVNYLKDSLNFATSLNEALPVVCTLLGSKQSSDVQEAINFFVSAFEFGLLNAMLGVRKMLSLIFSRFVFLDFIAHNKNPTCKANKIYKATSLHNL